MHKYRHLLRPASTFTLPPGVKWEFVEAPHEGVNRPDLKVSAHKYGVIQTDRRLTSDECDHFDIASA
jgi:hypothetical protein